MLANGYLFFLRFFLSDDEHVRDFFYLIIPYFLANFLIPVVKKAANIVLFHQSQNFFCIIVVFIADRQHGNLLRSKPQREVSGIMLDEESDEPLVCSQRRPMN